MLLVGCKGRCWQGNNACNLGGEIKLYHIPAFVGMLLAAFSYFCQQKTTNYQLIFFSYLRTPFYK